MKVAVLGCGPAGLIAAWAAEQAGADVQIYSKKVQSIIPGSQYLHGPIPGVSSPYAEGVVQYIRLGTAEQYALKVYGDIRETGWDNYYAVYKSWNVRRAYHKLWDYFEPNIIDLEIDGLVLSVLLGEADKVISTIPQPALCHNDDHDFKGAEYYLRQLPTPPADENHDICVYNGLPDDPWYRWSILGGTCSIEYTKPPSPNEENGWRGEGWTTGLKCTTNDCDCYAHEKFMRVGRWAKWRHGVLLHDIYEEVYESVTEGATV